MSVLNLLHLDYWFSQPFTARGLALWLLVGIFLLFVVKGLILKILSQYQENKSLKTFFRRSGNLGLAMGFLGLLLMFFRQEHIPFLAWRFWLLLWVVVTVIWVYHLARYALKRMPEIKAEEERRISIEKYLPKRS